MSFLKDLVRFSKDMSSLPARRNMRQRITEILALIKRFIERVLLSLGAVILAAWFGYLGYLWGVEAWDMGDPPKSVLAVLAFGVSAFFVSCIPRPWRRVKRRPRRTAPKADSAS